MPIIVKNHVIEMIKEVDERLLVISKELVEANLNEDSSMGSECFEINSAFEEIADGLAVFKVYADKM